MAIYELEERVFFDGAIAADASEIEDMSVETNNELSVEACGNTSNNYDSTENVSIAPNQQYSVETYGNTSEDSEQSVETENFLSNESEPQPTEPTGTLESILDSLNSTELNDISEIHNQQSEINNVLLISSDNNSIEKIYSSLNDNTTLIEYSSSDSIETILENIKAEFGDSKAVNIGIVNSSQLSVDSRQPVETCANTFFSLAELTNALYETETVDGTVDVINFELGGESVDSNSPLTEFFNTDSPQFNSLFGDIFSNDSTTSLSISDISNLTSETDSITTDIYFIDSAVEDTNILIEEITSENPDAIIVELSEGEGLDSMTDIVNQYRDIDSVHILSQGNYAQIILGNDVITDDNIDDYSDAFSSWSDNLTHDADILFYGCDIAKEAQGQSVLNQIAEWTGADIAASTDITGSSNHGTHGNDGSISNFSSSLIPIHSSTEIDWDLEYTIGSIEASAIAAVDYNHHLETYTVTETTDDGTGTVAGSLSWAIEQANATTTVDDTINFNLTSGNTVTLSGGSLTISDDLTINGGRTTITFEDRNAGLIIDDANDSTQINVTLENLTIVEACGNTSTNAESQDNAEEDVLPYVSTNENLTIVNSSINNISYVYAHIPSNIANPKVLLASSGLNDVDDLVAAAKDDVIVLEYDPNVTSLSDLSTMVNNALNGRKASSIAFANHSTGDNQFYLTDSEIISIGSTLTRTAQQQFWQNIGSMINEGGRIDLLACNLAAGTAGEILIATLESTAGINIAASTDTTGNPENGGNWTLETDNINSIDYFQAENLTNYTGLMGWNTEELVNPSPAAALCISMNQDGSRVFVSSISDVSYYQNSDWSNPISLAVPPLPDITSISVSDNGDTAAVVASNGIAAVYSFATGEWRPLIAPAPGPPNYQSISVDADGNTIAVISNSNAYILDSADNWNTITTTPFAGFPAGTAQSISINNAANVVAVGTASGALIYLGNWAAPSINLDLSPVGLPNDITSISLDAGGGSVAVGTTTGACVVSLGDPMNPMLLTGSEGVSIHSISISSDGGSIVYSTGAAPEVYVYQNQNWGSPTPIPGITGAPITTTSISADGTLLAFVDAGGTACVSNFIPTTLDHFEFSFIPNQTVGIPFNITVNAIGDDGNPYNYTGDVEITDPNDGAIIPVHFDNESSHQQSITISAEGTYTITGICASGPVIASNPFTVSVPVPGDFSLVSPENDTTEADSTVEFDWEDSSGATEYTLTITNTKTSVSTEYTGSESNYTVTDIDNGAYSWNVTATNGTSTTQSLETYTLTIAVPSPSPTPSPTPKPSVDNGMMINDSTQIQTQTSWRTSIDNGPQNDIDSDEGFDPNEVEGVGLTMGSMISFDLSVAGASNGEYSVGTGSASAFMMDGEYGLDSAGVSGMSDGEYGAGEEGEEQGDEFGSIDLTFNFDVSDELINFEGMAVMAQKHPTFKTELDLLLEKI